MLVDCDLLTLETMTRDHVGESDPRMWSQARVFRAINDEYAKMCREALESDQQYFGTSTDITVSSTTVALPRNLWKARAFLVYRDSRWYPIEPINPSEKYWYEQAANSTAYARAFRFQGRNVILEPGYANVSSMRILYDRAPASLIYGQATAGAATTMTLATTSSVFDDIYIGDEFELLSGTGSGQVASCSDYVGSTKVATFPTWTTNPDATTYYSTILADPINKFPELVAIGAAYRLLHRRRDTELFQVLQSQYQEEYAMFKNSLQPRQTDQPRYGEFVPREDD
jgi:hypothetical protein